LTGLRRFVIAGPPGLAALREAIAAGGPISS
jgi:hypothetical protein